MNPSPLLTALEAQPAAAVAVTDGSGEHRWEALRRRAAAGAARLAERLPTEAGPDGPRVGMLVSPGADWVATWLSILQAGGIAVPLCPAYPDRELGEILTDAGASGLVVSAGLERPGLAADLTTTTAAELLAGGDGVRVAPPTGRAGGATAMLLYTSGTTGKPKGVRLTHDALLHQARLLGEAWALGPKTQLLHALPLHHMHGVAIALLPCLVAGAQCRMVSRFDAATVWAELGTANTFMGVPTMYHRLLSALDQADPTTQARWTEAAAALELATSGSAALPARLAERWRCLTGAIPLERYGMTEIGVGCSNPWTPSGRRVGSVGPPLPTFDLRLVAEGIDTDRGPGEVWLRSPSIFEAYWRRPDATAEAFSGAWFKTGDTAERDDEGYVRLLGRTSIDILKSGGYKLSALQIEEVIREHEAVSEVAVVGLPDEAWGQRVVAAIVSRPGQAAACQTGQLRPWAKKRLAAYKVPRAFVVLEALPVNALGKVVKPALIELLLAAQLDDEP
ncbi:MAG: AMP-binding protein [Deltaproteobacteria bacterium]|nr:AMP-binding protein [Deltaproteobacteria bacterium]